MFLLELQYLLKLIIKNKIEKKGDKKLHKIQ